ncbi:MAG: hypothetical protein CL897_00310 [Dehalococcoidia bacterium]|nr:hypothetical protein [Dehalococcoidia bacterium]HCV00234.1 hypothetical protein [Dehalococcoidia bacterium]
MASKLLKIGKVRPCDCGKHSSVVLHECRGKARISVPVHPDIASWFAPDKDGVGCLFTGIGEVLRGIGWEPRAVILTCDENRKGQIWLRLGNNGAETDVECEPGVALLTAERIGLPILLEECSSEAARTVIPDVYHEVLTDLGLLDESSA